MKTITNACIINICCTILITKYVLESLPSNLVALFKQFTPCFAL